MIGLVGSGSFRSFGTMVDNSDADSFVLEVKKQMKIHEMKEEESWENMKPYWNGLVLLAKDNDRQMIERMLYSICNFTPREAQLLSEWFLLNFKKEAIQSKCFLFCFILFCNSFLRHTNFREIS